MNSFFPQVFMKIESNLKIGLYFDVLIYLELFTKTTNLIFNSSHGFDKLSCYNDVDSAK